MPSFHHYLPTEIQFGVGSIRLLPEHVARLAPRSVLILTGQGFQKRQPELVSMLEKIPGATFYSKIVPNPDLKHLDSVRKDLAGVNPDLILGIGGGSVLDSARVLSVTLGKKESLRDLFAHQKKFLPRRTHLILCPTTSGTASEVTSWSTVWDFEEKKKLSLSHPSLYADLAVIDPALVVGLPADVTAQTGMDTLSHAMESLWSKGCTSMTKIFAGEAIQLVLTFLPNAVSDIQNLEARVGMARACLLAGLAFSQTKTAAAHSMSYPLTLLHGVPHGIACSITLPMLLEENTTIPERMTEIAGYFGCKTPGEARIKLENFMKQIGIPTKLSELGISKADLSALCEGSFTQGRMDNHAHVLARPDVEKILNRIF